jgi:subtilase family serine protease
MSGFVPLPGSDRAEIPDAMPAGDIDPAQRIEVTLILRRRAELPAGTYGLSSDQLAETYGADPADIARVREVLTGYGLTVTSAHQASRRMKVAGSIADLSHAFGTTLSMVSSRHPGADHRVRHRYRTGPLMVPAELSGTVTAVLGLDDRPAARAHFRPSASGSGTATFTAVQVAQAYEFPPGTDGSGQTIAIIELGGGFSTADLATYFSGLGIDQPAGTGAPAGGLWRGVPDVAGNADPATGYQVIVDGKSQVYGGTSAVAPLWATLIARLAQGVSKRLGLLHPALYRGIAPGTEVPGFRDITSGSNGAYSATRGWDPCTGLGSPDGAALLTRLTAIIGIDDVS